MALSYRKQIELAHELGAKYEVGRWKFPSDEAAATFRRRVAGMEWTPEQKAAADEALRQQHTLMANKTFIDMEPGGK